MTPPWRSCPEEVALTPDQVDRLEREGDGDNELQDVHQCELWGEHHLHISRPQSYGLRNAAWIRWDAKQPGELIWGVDCPVAKHPGGDAAPFCVLWAGHGGRHFIIQPEDEDPDP